MKTGFLTFLLIVSLAQSQSQCGKSEIDNVNVPPVKMPESLKFGDLPDGIELTDDVREEIKTETGEISYEIITVEEKLKSIGAKAEGKSLVDANGTEIKFYKPPVRGASQGFEEDRKQQDAEAQELRKLKEKFTVIVLYENPLKVM